MLSLLDIVFLVSAVIFASAWVYAMGSAQEWNHARDEHRAVKKTLKAALRALR